MSEFYLQKRLSFNFMPKTYSSPQSFITKEIKENIRIEKTDNKSVSILFGMLKLKIINKTISYVVAVSSRDW